MYLPRKRLYNPLDKQEKNMPIFYELCDDQLHIGTATYHSFEGK